MWRLEERSYLPNCRAPLSRRVTLLESAAARLTATLPQIANVTLERSSPSDCNNAPRTANSRFTQGARMVKEKGCFFAEKFKREELGPVISKPLTLTLTSWGLSSASP